MGYDVTCACERLLCTSRLLQLEPDEAGGEGSAVDAREGLI